jgi:transcriptional regulator with XRE-family HTH domain
LEADYGSELNESNISKYENGKREPQLSTILKLAKMLKIHPKELLDFGVDFTPENPNKESTVEGSSEARFLICPSIDGASSQ